LLTSFDGCRRLISFSHHAVRGEAASFTAYCRVGP
jgi:hypothetical protein